MKLSFFSPRTRALYHLMLIFGMVSFGLLSNFAQSPCVPDLGYIETPPPAPLSAQCMGVGVQEVGSGAGQNQTRASQVFPNISTLSNWALRVKGTFVIDKDFTFELCQVFFDEGATMVTSGTVTLVGLESNFRPCSDFVWKGIVINAGGAIQFNKCDTWGAETALTLKKDYRGNNSLMIDNKFSRNEICISCTDLGAQVRFSAFYQNYFSGAGTLPGSAIKPRVGINLANCLALIGSVILYDPGDIAGTYDYWVNEFRNFQFGIDATNATVTVKNCGFYQMRPENDANGQPTGCGIRAQNCGLLSIGAGFFETVPVGYCDFDYCAFAGINANNTRTQLQYARFRGTQLFGITSKNTKSRYQYVANCDVILAHATNKCGIQVERPGNIAGVSATISHNIVAIQNPGNAASLSGIELRCPNPASNSALIDHNDISLSGNTFVSYGLIVYGNQTFNNIIEYNHCVGGSGSGNDFGIFLTDFDGKLHQVRNNTSEGLYNCNFHTQRAKNVTYCDNTCTGATNGFHFMGDNTGTVWSVNDVGAHAEGLLVEDLSGSGGKIGEQVRKGNMWEGNDALYSDKAAKCNALPVFSPFYVEEENNKVIFPTKIVPVEGWFRYEEGDLQHCSVTGDVSPFYNRYIAGDLPSGYLSPAEHWEVGRQLMTLLLENPAVANDGGVLQTFRNLNLNNSKGLFAQAEVSLRTHPFITVAQQTQLDGLYALQAALLAEIGAYQQSSTPVNLTVGGVVIGDNPTLQAKVDHLEATAAAIENLLASIAPAWQAHLQNVLSQVQAITVSQPYEQAWKTLKIWELEGQLGISTAARLAEVLTLAGGNPLSQGDAVRHAWHYLPECEKYPKLAAEEINNIPRGAQRGGNNADGLTPLQIHPNPAQDEVLISIPSGELTGRWTLYNVSGVALQSGDWDSGMPTLRLSVATLPDGVYFFTVLAENGAPRVARIVVTH